MIMANAITRFHAKYYAALLSGQSANGDIGSLSQSLLSSTVDINPHQIDAALFAFASPFSKGVVLADEVGLGKTIEAGLVVCQYWATGKRKFLQYLVMWIHQNAITQKDNCTTLVFP